MVTLGATLPDAVSRMNVWKKPGPEVFRPSASWTPCWPRRQPPVRRLPISARSPRVQRQPSHFLLGSAAVEYARVRPEVFESS